MIRIISYLLIFIGLTGLLFSAILPVVLIITVFSLLLIAVGLTLFVLGVFRIRLSFFMKSICTIPFDNGFVALTFDDGPGESTGFLLDVLDEYNIKATFFCTGKQALKYPALVKRIIDTGHTIGTHTYSHLKSFTISGFRNVYSEIKHGVDALYNITGRRPILFRPPFGITNPVITRGVKVIGVISVGWNIRSLDTISDNKEKILSRVIPKLKPGSIVLLHDHRKATLEVLPTIIKEIYNLGLKPVNLEQALNIKVYEDTGLSDSGDIPGIDAG